MGKITIIAEAGISHQGNMSLARELILRTKETGADIWKTQLYDVDALFPDKKIITQGRNWYDEVKKTQLTKEQVFQLAEWCKETEIEFMSSCFDLERLGWLEEIGVKRYKVASIVNQNRELIDAMSRTGKEVLISCRRRYFAYVSKDYRNNFKYLYCIPKYPTELKDLEFDKINFPEEFQGLSDHTAGVEASMIAMARGAKIIEKHFCLKRDNSNPDMVCSIEPDELSELVRFARKVEEILW